MFYKWRGPSAVAERTQTLELDSTGWEAGSSH